MNEKEYLADITLLYVEDDKPILDIYSSRLEKIVKQLYIASNGQEAYNIYMENKPDIIITDIKMSGINGLDLAHKIRDEDPNIPIIVTSAYNTVDYLTQALHLDISGYLVKPIDHKKMFSMLISQAKVILAKKNEQQRQNMLQAIINADSHMLAVTDLKEIFFANNTFINFFHLDNSKQFNEKYKTFTDIFIEHGDMLSNSKITQGENFMELYLKASVSDRNVLLFDFNNFTPKTFHIKITPIDRKNNKDIYLVTLIDISVMTIEKVELKNKVYYDALTNVYNRNKLDEVFKYELVQAQRYGSIFSMILVDIDHFKKFNDTYGHLVGDEVLVLLAKTIEKITRSTDTFARWGGEEFVIVLPNTTKENAAILAEHIRKDVEKLRHKKAGLITASFGISQFEKNDTQESMYQKCDKALYKAKENGRNRVEVYY
ncbi:MAG: diguanylate cyclase [Campylobacterales bacterium]|nr:diguanylate cyclase [Campylobacterales bacterium]